MSMLDRIKKRQFDGFKEFVQNMEITGTQTRVPIFTAGILEDPLFMGWVMKNLRTFDDFMNLPGEDIEAVLGLQDQMMGLLAKCLHGAPEKIKAMEATIPKSISKLKDELSYLNEVTSAERDSARFYLVKTVRKLQVEEKIQGFPWKLPPYEIFFPKAQKDGPSKIMFDSGVLAAEGPYSKGKRSGQWVHNYENGKLLAKGDYLDGSKTGEWVFFYSNGNIKAEGRYKGDQRNGVWKEWDRNGVMLEVEYEEGAKKRP